MSKKNHLPERHRWRVFHKGAIAHVDQEMPLDPDEVNFLRVLRLSAGQEVEVTDGAGTVALAVISEMTKKEVHLRVKRIWHPPPLTSSVEVFLGRAKNSAIEESVESASQMGATHFSLFHCQKAVQRQSLHPERMQKISREAARISKTAYLMRMSVQDTPGLLLETLTESLVGRETERTLLLVCDESPLHSGDLASQAPSLLSVLLLARAQKATRRLIVIGPEGGLVEQERTELISWAASRPLVELHFVGLGPYILTVPNAVRSAVAVAVQVSSS